MLPSRHTMFVIGYKQQMPTHWRIDQDFLDVFITRFMWLLCKTVRVSEPDNWHIEDILSHRKDHCTRIYSENKQWIETQKNSQHEQSYKSASGMMALNGGSGDADLDNIPGCVQDLVTSSPSWVSQSTVPAWRMEGTTKGEIQNTKCPYKDFNQIDWSMP